MTAALRNISRRKLLKAGTGLVVGIAYGPLLALAHGTELPAQLPGSLNGNRLLSAWLRVNSNGTVTVFTGKVELGQGIASALAQVAAEELDVGYRRINMVTADTSRTPDEGFTAGSQSIEQSGTAIRFACAEARHMLLAAAAVRLGVDAGGLTVADGTIAAPDGQTTYWAVTTDAMLRREATGQFKPKAAGEHKLIGQSLARRDIPPKFTGSVRVTRAWSAVDAGLVINPDGIVNQIEGGLIQSASWTLKEAVKVDRSGVRTSSWIDYPILRFSEVPAVEVELIRRPADDSLGAGEGAQGPTGAAIANAFAAATGRRLRDIPFTPERVRATLA